MTLRSQRWFRGGDETALAHRAALRSAGVRTSPGDDRPIIGILNTYSELNPCNMPLRDLAIAVKRGVGAAGGIGVEIPTMSLGEDLMKPTAMLYRNLLAIEVEEVIRAYPLDGVVLLGNCDKTIPAQLMGAASADVPALQVSGGYRRTGSFRGSEVGAGTDLWKWWDERRAGRLGDSEWRDLEEAMGCTQGACNVMGTAMTMAIMAEVLGMMLPGSSVLPFDDARLEILAVESGSRIVELVSERVTPSMILTRAAFSNAMLALAAVGGSTNAIIHLCAIAGRRGIDLPLEAFDEAAHSVPVLADIAPIGRWHISAFDAAGAVPALLGELAPLLDPNVVTVSGRSSDPSATPRRSGTAGAIRPFDHPVTFTPTFVVLRGNLCPAGAVLKTPGGSESLLQHSGPAVVFRGYADMLNRIDDPDLDVAANSVLVLTGCGPRGGDGFPEWGMIPIPRKLAAAGVSDMVRVSDSRMSGTSYGTCVLHVAPDSGSGGPLALVQDGDLITLDVRSRRLDLKVSDGELQSRRSDWRSPVRSHRRGWPALYDQHVLQAPMGADFDFLRPASEQELEFVDSVVGRS